MIGDHPGITIFNEILSEHLQYYIELCSSVGEPAAEQGKLIQEAFKLCLGIMEMSLKYTKPPASEMSKLVQPIYLKVCEIGVGLACTHIYQF